MPLINDHLMPTEGRASMWIFSFSWKYGLWIFPLVFSLGAYLTWSFVMAAGRLSEKNLVCSLPLVAEQEVPLAKAGTVALWLEGPLLSKRSIGLQYQLSESNTAAIAGRKPLFPLSSSGFSRGRKLERIFSIPHPGLYILRISGPRASLDPEEKHQLLFMRPHLLQTVLSVLGIILGAALLIGGVVGFCLRLLRAS
jgi:hypothetical protein